MLGGHKQVWWSKSWIRVIKKYILCKSLHQTKNVIVTLTRKVPRTPVKSTTVRTQVLTQVVWCFEFSTSDFLEWTQQDLQLEIIAIQNTPKGTDTNWVESPNQWQKLVALKAACQSDARLLENLNTFYDLLWKIFNKTATNKQACLLKWGLLEKKRKTLQWRKTFRSHT